MRWGALRDHFLGVAWKRLTPHEVDPRVSNGHEFQGVGVMRELLGETERRNVAAKYLFLADDPLDSLVLESTISWYDSRVGQAHRAPEWRLYYPKDAGAIQARMVPGDLMVICVRANREIAVLLARADTASEAQLRRLFAIGDAPGERVTVRTFEPSQALDFTTSLVLEELALGKAVPDGGKEADEVAAIAAALAERNASVLPTSERVSDLVASHVTDVDPVADPDHALYRWVEAEAAAYRAWEDLKIAREITAGFTDTSGAPDVGAFRRFTMSLRQSRVSRAGSALQNHMARILRANRIRFDAQATTEPGERPDFLFPGAAEYRDPTYPSGKLRMLAVKFTVKERWRQVLNEADRVREKHLLTLDAALTRSTLGGMHAALLQPVLPHAVLSTYPTSLQPHLLSVRALIEGVLSAGRG